MEYQGSLTRKSVSIWHISSVLGGAERSFLDTLPLELELCAIHVPSDGPFTKELSQQVAQNKIVITEYPKSIYALSRTNGSKNYYYIGLIFFTILQFFWKLNKILKLENPDIIYSYGLKNHFLLTPIAIYRKIPIVWHLQDYWPTSIFAKIFLNVCLKFQISIITNSIDVAKKLKISNLKKARVQTIYNSIDTNTYKFSDRSIKEKIIIAFIGMIVPWKGLNIFLESTEYLKKEVSFEMWNKLEFWIVGGMPYQTNQHDNGYSKNLLKDLPKNIAIKGLKNNMAEVYSNIDIFCHTSIRPEPFGRVIIEAMASGAIVVASNEGGPREIISDRIDGYLFEPRNPLDLSRKIAAILNHSNEKNAEMKKMARKKVLDKFDKIEFRKRINNFLQNTNSRS